MSASNKNGGGNNCNRSFVIDIPPVEEEDCSGYITLCCEGGNLGGSFGINRQNGGLNGNSIKNIREGLQESGLERCQITKVIALYRLAYQKIVAKLEKERALLSGATQANGEPANCGSQEGYTPQSNVVYRMPQDLFSSSFTLQVDLKVRNGKPKCKGKEFYTISINETELVAPRVDADGNYVLINNRPVHDVNLSGFILEPVRQHSTRSTEESEENEENEDCNPVGTVDEEGNADCDDPCPCPCEEDLSEMDCCMGPWKDSPPAIGGGEHPGVSVSRAICRALIADKEFRLGVLGSNGILL